jgi:biopolymer transport protein ExbD
MALQGQGEVDEVLSEINVTPLVDIMLVLLVVFIVTAPLLTNAVKVHLPQTSTTAPIEQTKAVTISIDRDGTIYVDRSVFALRDLEPELKRQRALRPDLTVHLNADEATNYGLVAKAMAAVDHAGIAKLSVLTLND